MATFDFTQRLRLRRAQWNQAPSWRTRLASKLASKRFAAQCGVPVPSLYWVGNDEGKAPAVSLPRDFVIKPLYGHSGIGVIPVANGINNLTGRPFTWGEAQAAIKRKARVLIEEYIPTADGRLDVVETFKVFVFDDQCVIRVNFDHFDRQLGTMETQWHSFFTEDWELINEPISTYAPCGGFRPAPEKLTELLEYARRLGRAYGTFVRVDFYVSPHAVVFGEFCPFPWNGKHFTRFGDEYFGMLWEKNLRNAI